MNHPIPALALLTAAAMAQPLIPPDTDFSKFQRHYSWPQSPEYIRELSHKVAGENRDESKAGTYTLPEMFKLSNGSAVRTAADWEQHRRAELLELFRSEIYGYDPPKPDNLTFQIVESDAKAMGGKATLKRIAIRFQLDGEPFTFHLILFVPSQRRGRVPVFVTLNHRSAINTDPTRKVRSEYWPAEYVISRGYAIAAINVADEVDPDKNNATTGIRVFYRSHSHEGKSYTWGAIGAWAWSASRAMDYLQTDPDINAARVAIMGHSRTGKTSLWAGAQDSRFSLVCVNEAGESGPALARRDYGETVAMITKNFPYWFAPKYATYADKVDRLPIDQHELVALVAPRAYHGGDASEDFHSDPKGSWLALVEASKVWRLYNRTPIKRLPEEMPLVNDLYRNGPIAYHIRQGGHALTTFDWKLYLDHADTMWK
ncbi:MAG TPA: hypothetical protein VGL72_01605 [Bryobacteraceae bacterium]